MLRAMVVAPLAAGAWLAVRRLLVVALLAVGSGLCLGELRVMIVAHLVGSGE